MKKNDPQGQPPNLQMTPVEFAPVKTTDAMGTIHPASSRTEWRFPVFIPLLIVLVSLNYSTYRSIEVLNARLDEIKLEEAPAQDLLQHAGDQNKFVSSLQAGLQKLAPDDPIAALILRDFPVPKAQQDKGTDVKPGQK